MKPADSADVRLSLRLSLIGTVASGLLQFVFMVVLARLLSPVEYGAYALCVAIVSLSAIFVVNVIERTLVVSMPTPEERDDGPTLGLLCAAAGGLALGIGVTLDRLQVLRIDGGVLALVAVSACIGATAVMPRVLLRREVRFGPIVAAEFAALVVGQGLVTIALAVAGWGTYALALGACAQSLCLAVALRLRARNLPLAFPSFERALNLGRAGLALGGNAAAELGHGQLPGLLLGFRLGALPLGLFNRSYSLVQMPIQLVVAALARVSVSALFTMRDERERLRAAARVLVRQTAVVVTPIAAGMAGASHNFVLLALGERWLEAAPIVPLIALSGWATMMGTLLGTVTEALRAFAARTRAQLAASAMMILLVVLGSAYGLFGAVTAIAMASLLYMLLLARLAARLLDRPLTSVLGWLVPGLVVGLPCFAVSLALDRLWEAPPALVFGTQVAACGIFAVALALAFYPALLLALVEAACPPALRLVPGLGRLRGLDREAS